MQECHNQLIKDLLQVCQNAHGLYVYAEKIGIDKQLPGYTHCFNRLKEVISRAEIAINED